MEYVAGETLQRRLRRGRVPLAEALRLGEEISEALEAAHKRRVVHCDLKPANVMVTEDGHIKVMDFGLAVHVAVSADVVDHSAIATQRVQTQTVLGTPAYMSPEQLRGEPADGRMDIFAFGVLLYELLSGSHPFLCSSLEATARAIMFDTPKALHEHVPTLPRAVSDVVARMLAKDPASRYQSFGDARLELRRLSSELTARETGPPQPVADASPPPVGPFVEREADHSELVRSIMQAAAGRGTLVLVGGDAGVGKTRLVEEALRTAREHRCLTLVGRCYEQRGAPSLAPYVEVLEDASRFLSASLFRDVIGSAAPELARIMPELRRTFPDMLPSLELPPEMRQRFLFQNVRDVLSRCSRVMPLVVFLDDLQWADESTLQLTHYLAQHLGKIPAIVIGAYRQADLAPPPTMMGALGHLLQRVRGESAGVANGGHPLARTIDQLRGQRLASVLTVRPLSQDAVGDVLTALARRDPPPRLVRRFFEHSGGNPFFVEELFRHLSEEGRLFDAAGRWRRDVELDEIDVPAGIRTVMSRRLERLSRKAQKVLTAAAIIGRPFDLELVEAASGVDGKAAIAALEQAERAQLVKGPSGRAERHWRFEHQVICQMLTRAVTRAEREQLHLRVARALRKLDAGSNAHASDIAHHLFSAGRTAEAGTTVHALMLAGDAADAVYATDEAIQHYARALEILTESAGADRNKVRAQERLADLLVVIGDHAGAMKHYTNAAASLEAVGSRIDLCRVIRRTGALHWNRGDRASATACYERALTMLEADSPADDGVEIGSDLQLELAHLYQQLGLASFRMGENQRAIEWAERALRSAEATLMSAQVAPGLRSVAAAAIAHASNTIGVALARTGRLEEARVRIEESVTVARQHGLLDVACRAYANLGVLYSTIEPKRALEVSLTGLELATKIGAPSLQSYLYANLASAYCALTDNCETDGLLAARTAADLDREMGQLDHLAVPLIVMGQIYQCQGDLHHAQDAYQEALILAEKAQEPQMLVPCYDGLATICLDRGDTTRAQEYMEKSRAVCERAGIDPDRLLVLPFLC